MPGQVSTGAGGLGEELPGDLQSGIDQQSGIDIDGPPIDGGSSMASGPAKFVQEGGSIDYTPGADVLVGAVVVLSAAVDAVFATSGDAFAAPAVAARSRARSRARMADATDRKSVV